MEYSLLHKNSKTLLNDRYKTYSNFCLSSKFTGRNVRTRTDLIKPHDKVGVNPNRHENNLALRTLFLNDHVVVRRNGSKQNYQHGKSAERISCKMGMVM